MPIDLPNGYLTRPEAAKIYNRSQRALERDLDVALTIKDQELLSHWKLVTKDGQVRDATDVTLENVKELVADGMAPAWCVAASFLKEKYGLKGTPRPSVLSQRPSESDSTTTEKAMRDKAPVVRSESFADDTAFLKEIVRRLEREKEQERERHDQIVTKLFGELDVKNKQISAWDEVTQGLTKALATGQIAPNLNYLPARAAGQETNPSPSQQEQTTADAIPVPPKETTGDTKRRVRKPSTHPDDTPPQEPKRKARVEKPASKDEQTSKPKWNEFPTLKKLFSRR